MPKHTILGYTKLNPVAILTTEHAVAEKIGQVMNITNLAREAPTSGTSLEREVRMVAVRSSCNEKILQWEFLRIALGLNLARRSVLYVRSSI